MQRMSEKTRQEIITIARNRGFIVQLSPEGKDLYDKNLVLRSARFSASPVYIHKVTGMAGISGEFNYLKVAVKPDAFVETLVQPDAGIAESINQQIKVNRHHSSNYVGFPVGVAGRHEPHAKCYQVRDLVALAMLFEGLNSASAR
jgi:hypothetical protein